MLARKTHKGLKISAELHDKLARSSKAVEVIDSEVVAVRKSMRRPNRKPLVSVEYCYIHAYG